MLTPQYHYGKKKKAVAKAAEGSNTESLNSEMLRFDWKLIFTKGAFIKEIEFVFKKRSNCRLLYRTFKTTIIPLATINTHD